MNKNALENRPWMFRGVLETRSPPEEFLRKTVLKICNKFTGEHPCQGEITLGHGCSPVTLLYIFPSKFPEDTSGRLLLYGRAFSWRTINYFRKNDFITDIWQGPKHASRLFYVVFIVVFKLVFIHKVTILLKSIKNV